MKKAGLVARITVNLPTPKTLFQIYYRGSWGKGSAQVRQCVEGWGIMPHLRHISTQLHYSATAVRPLVWLPQHLTFAATDTNMC